MTPVDGGVCAPKGFRAAGVNAGIKHGQTKKSDCALILSDVEAAIAGVFTTNLLKAPPIKWTEGVCIRGKGRAIFINSGNANACTGQQGINDAQATAEKLALGLDVPITEVAVLSTGVIGVPLPMDRIATGVERAVTALSFEGHSAAAEAIMTTDTVSKEYALEVPLSTGVIRIGAMAKGSGMISPNMATMLAFVTTDAAIEGDLLRQALRDCTEDSFNAICVDNDMSTSDACIALANGAAELPPLEAGSADYDAFVAGLRVVCIKMAQWLVRDGEGATKFVEIRVAGTRSKADAQTIARAIAHSMLCKTAFFGQDANWGRIACAAGYAGVEFDPGRLSIAIDGLEVVYDGMPTDYAEADAAARMAQTEIGLDVRVGDGPAACTFWTSDLSYKYVEINADYRT